MKPFIFLSIAFIGTWIGSSVKADTHTHQLGNAVYAVREARLERANRSQPHYYWQSVRRLREAQLAFKRRNLTAVVQLANEARNLAKMAVKAER